MTFLFRIGDKVKLKETCRWLKKSTSRVGTVESLSDVPFISWPNISYFIQESDLKHASIVNSEDHLKEKDVL